MSGPLRPSGDGQQPHAPEDPRQNDEDAASTRGAPQTPISITRALSPARRAYEVARMPNPMAPSRSPST